MNATGSSALPCMFPRNPVIWAHTDVWAHIDDDFIFMGILLSLNVVVFDLLP